MSTETIIFNNTVVKNTRWKIHLWQIHFLLFGSPIYFLKTPEKFSWILLAICWGSSMKIFGWKNWGNLVGFPWQSGGPIRFCRFIQDNTKKFSWILLAICWMEWSSKGFVGFHLAPNSPPRLIDHNGDDHGNYDHEEKEEQNVMMRKNFQGRWKKHQFFGQFYWTPVRKAMQLRNGLIFLQLLQRVGAG